MGLRLKILQSIREDMGDDNVTYWLLTAVIHRHLELPNDSTKEQIMRAEKSMKREEK